MVRRGGDQVLADGEVRKDLPALRHQTDAALRDELQQLGLETELDAAMLRQARTLFARAIEAPGGLKIQTIHSFCAALLRRFPLEAGVSPQFHEMDERASRLLAGTILDDISASDQQPVIGAVAAYCNETDVMDLIASVLKHRQLFAKGSTKAEIWARLNLPVTLTAEALCAGVFTKDVWGLIGTLVNVLSTGSASDQRNGEKLAKLSGPNLEALGLLESVNSMPGLRLEGLFSHFPMSDESDKSFALEQIGRFQALTGELEQAGIIVPCRHLCNSGGFLDLPDAHLDMVRIGLLPLGVYPSKVCRRIPGVEPVGTVKTRLAVVKKIHKGDNVGYGLRYQAPGERRIGVLPVGYGDGYPRVRNQGHVLVHGKRAPVIGANAMDSTMVDLTAIPEAAAWDEVVLMGRQGESEITPHDLAAWKGTVSYEVLTGWRSRLPRVYLDSLIVEGELKQVKPEPAGSIGV